MGAERGNPLDGAAQTLIIERMLPLYEAKMLHQFDHRWATYDGTVDSKGQPAARDVTMAEKVEPDFAALPRYWVEGEEVANRLASRWSQQWLMGWRDIARSTDERTVIASGVGLRASPEGGTLLLLPNDAVAGVVAVLAALDSLAFDFVARQKVGGTHVKYFTMKQLPVPGKVDIEAVAPFTVTERWGDWLRSRVLELTYTAWDMASFAEDLGDTDPEGKVNPPFIWDDERRSWLRSELDAAFFHLYGIERNDVRYIMETFPIVRRKDDAAYGEYRTRNRILAVYDALQSAAAVGEPYRSVLDPAPGHGLRHESRQECT
ncbi:MAG: hypothetical protein QG597_3773 [Actinomycetota bacterium]|nr:hypothetical protein [Actinomycetota bacterium]